MLTWVHFGDLHASHEDGWSSVSALESLIDDVNRNLLGAVDLAVLPGDNANHGEREQYERLSAVLDELELPWAAIPGDHDFEPGSLDPFYEGLATPRLPLAKTLGGRRCLFLDIVSPGAGGPDFRLGASQSAWLRAELDRASADPEPPVVFMHAFPDDLAADGLEDGALGPVELGELLARHGVSFVDTGHTHYNELLNDGAVVYAATRSTGQVEEGPVGYTLANVDGTQASWTFKALGSPWPLVMITSPADARLAVSPPPATSGGLQVRAKVFGPAPGGGWRVEARLDDAPAAPLAPAPGEAAVWQGEIGAPSPGEHELWVRVRGADGVVAGEDRIRLRSPFAPPPPGRPGSAETTVGAWPERGLLGTRLGPNANGRQW